MEECMEAFCQRKEKFYCFFKYLRESSHNLLHHECYNGIKCWAYKANHIHMKSGKMRMLAYMIDHVRLDKLKFGSTRRQIFFFSFLTKQNFKFL